jgi:hypothetical protein
MPRTRNLTLRVEDQVLLWARMRALFRGQSLNRMINDFLEELADIPPDGKPSTKRPWLLHVDRERLAQERREADQRRDERRRAREAWAAEAEAARRMEEEGESDDAPANGIGALGGSA